MKNSKSSRAHSLSALCTDAPSPGPGPVGVRRGGGDHRLGSPQGGSHFVSFWSLSLSEGMTHKAHGSSGGERRLDPNPWARSTVATARRGSHRLLKCSVVLRLAFNFPRISQHREVDTCLSLYRSPIVAVTNYRKLGGLKLHTFTASRFGRSESEMRLPELKIQVSVALPSFLDVLGKNQSSCCFQLVEATCRLGHRAPFHPPGVS